MTTFFQSLKAGIMPFHEEAERYGPLHSIASGTSTAPEYRAVLKRLYGFVLPAEQMIEPLIERSSIGFEYRTLRRCPHLEQDLTFFGTTEEELARLPRCGELTTLDTLEKALGMLYLFEGSRLGGLVLAKTLRENLGFSGLEGYAYFASNGADVAEMWQSFKQQVSRYVASTGCEEQIIESARSGFASLNAWLMN